MAEEQKTMTEEEREKMLQEYPPLIREMVMFSGELAKFESVTFGGSDAYSFETREVFAGLREGGVGILAAPSGTGKSYFALYLSLLESSKISLKDPFRTKYAVNKILYINYKDRLSEFKGRQKHIVSLIKDTLTKNGEHITEQDIIHSYFFDNFLAVHPEGNFFLFKEQEGRLIRMKKNFRILRKLSKGRDVIVIDAWNNAALISNKNDRAISEAIVMLKEFAKKENIAILILYRTNKDVCDTPYCDVDYILQIQRLTKNSNVEIFGNKKLTEYVDFLNNDEKNSNVKVSNNNELIEHLDIRDRILIYERKNNYGQKKACIYVRDNMGAFFIFQKPLKIFI